MNATLSLAGMMSRYPTLFDDIVLPNQADRETVLNRLLLDTIELEVMISSGPIMQEALGVYSKSRLPSWTKYAEALGLDYDPLAADDTTETETASSDRKTNTDSNASTTGQNTGSDSTTREVTGFDSNQLQTAEKSTTQLGTGNTASTTGSAEMTENGNSSIQKTRTGRAGRDPQDLVRKEIALAAENLTELIVSDIKQQFCLLVY